MNDENIDIFDIDDLEDESIKSILKNLSTGAENEEASNDEMRKNLMNSELNFSNTIQHIPLGELIEIDDSINFFELPSDEEFIELAHSIETYGVINPLVVMRSEASEKYIVILGRSRLYVLRSLFETSKLEKYSTVPCIILEGSPDVSLIQGMIVTTNLKYRKISRETMIKSIFTLDDALKKNKRHRNEINVANAIAKRAGVSRTTVNNYMALKPLSSDAMELVNTKHMDLGVARILARQDHERQKFIMETLGDNINDINKVNSLIQGPGRSIYDEETKKAVPDNWERTIEFTKKMVPPFASITIKLPCEAVGLCLDAILDVRKKFGFENRYTEKEINHDFRIKTDERIMAQYVARGYVKQEVFNKIKKKEKKNQELDLGAMVHK